MSEKHTQTWWDENLPTRYNEFASWVGGSESYTKKFFRDYVKEKKYESLIDLGCGPATEFFAYKEDYPELKYVGVDSSEFLYKKNVEKGVPMIMAEAAYVPLLKDSSYDVVYCRHVLEHQPKFLPILSEMIRLAKKEAIHVFFIIPGDEEIIDYDDRQNLYHNTFSKPDIENYLNSHYDVSEFKWIQLTETEAALCITKIPLE
jgi:ubiquinone/menaquinone biosynthesis C-methylase UbiE